MRTSASTISMRVGIMMIMMTMMAVAIVAVSVGAVPLARLRQQASSQREALATLQPKVLLSVSTHSETRVQSEVEAEVGADFALEAEQQQSSSASASESVAVTAQAQAQAVLGWARPFMCAADLAGGRGLRQLRAVVPQAGADPRSAPIAPVGDTVTMDGFVYTLDPAGRVLRVQGTVLDGQASNPIHNVPHYVDAVFAADNGFQRRNGLEWTDGHIVAASLATSAAVSSSCNTNSINFFPQRMCHNQGGTVWNTQEGDARLLQRLLSPGAGAAGCVNIDIVFSYPAGPMPGPGNGPMLGPVNQCINRAAPAPYFVATHGTYTVTVKDDCAALAATTLANHITAAAAPADVPQLQQWEAVAAAAPAVAGGNGNGRTRTVHWANYRVITQVLVHSTGPVGGLVYTAPMPCDTTRTFTPAFDFIVDAVTLTTTYATLGGVVEDVRVGGVSVASGVASPVHALAVGVNNVVLTSVLQGRYTFQLTRRDATVTALAVECRTGLGGVLQAQAFNVAFARGRLAGYAVAVPFRYDQCVLRSTFGAGTMQYRMQGAAGGAAVASTVASAPIALAAGATTHVEAVSSADGLYAVAVTRGLATVTDMRVECSAGPTSALQVERMTAWTRGALTGHRATASNSRRYCVLRAVFTAGTMRFRRQGNMQPWGGDVTSGQPSQTFTMAPGNTVTIEAHSSNDGVYQITLQHTW